MSWFKKKNKEPGLMTELQLAKLLSGAKLTAAKIATRIIRVGDEWMLINPDTFRVSRCIVSCMCSGVQVERRITIVLAGVRPGVKIPRIIGKLQESFIVLGFHRDEISVVCEAIK